MASTFAHLAGIAIQQAQRAAELRANLQTVARQNELLRHSTAIEERLTKLVLEGGDARRHRDRRLRPDRQAVRDPRRRLPPPGRRLRPATARSRPPACSTTSSVGLPAVAAALAGLKPNRPVIVDAVPCAGLLHRFLVARGRAATARTWGYLAVMEYGSRFTQLDLADRCATRRPRSRSSSPSRAARRPPTARPREGARPRSRQRARGPGLAGAPRGVPELPHGRAARRRAARAAGRGGTRCGPTSVEAAYAEVADEPIRGPPRVPQNGVARRVELDEELPRPAALATVQGRRRAAARAARRRAPRAGRDLQRVPRARPTTARVHGGEQVLAACQPARRRGLALALLAADDLGAGAPDAQPWSTAPRPIASRATRSAR